MFISLAAIAVLISVMALLVCPAAEQTEAVSLLASDAWLESFSLRGYKPMLRLAARDDGRYLKSLREGGSGLKRYRRIQRSLLREYLRSLSRDFQRLHAIAAEKNLRPESDAGALPIALFEQRIGFILHMWSIEARLLIHALIPHRIDLEPLLANVETLAVHARETIRRPLRFGTI